jgi:hypothetical protein
LVFIWLNLVHQVFFPTVSTVLEIKMSFLDNTVSIAVQESVHWKMYSAKRAV